MTAELRRGDREARRVAQTVFDRPLLLEAGAGTGKTTTLVARILAWCLGPGWERQQHVGTDLERAASVLERVVAITFTEAAAGEMADRVALAMREVAGGGQPLGLQSKALPAEAPSRARALLLESDRLVICTIHAFCRRMLASFPLEAGLHPGFVVDAEERLAAHVAREVMESRLRDAYAEPGDRDFLWLAEQGHGPRELEEALLRAIETHLPADGLEEDPFSSERVASFLAAGEARFAAFREAEAGRLAQVSARSTRTHEVDLALREIGAAFPTTADRPALERFVSTVREHWVEEQRDRLRAWAQGRFSQGEAAKLRERTAELAASAGPLERWLEHALGCDPKRLDSARAVIAPLLQAVHRRLRANGIVTFAGLLHGARALLFQNPEIAASLRRGIDQLLVDEFQDTDTVQCEIVGALALGGLPDERPGLFVVGDPKQSIYGWRNADLAAYESFSERLLGCGGERHELAVNYRSCPEILAEVERILAPAMKPAPGLQPPYRTLLAQREDRGTVEHWISWDCEPRSGERRPLRASGTAQLEARALAADLRRIHQERGVAFGEIGVLLRSRSDLDTYLGALREADVPFHVEGDRNYFRRREIVDAGALVRCIVDPNDHVSLVAWLRSACVGVPDAALIPLWAGGFPEKMTLLRGPAVKALEELREIVLAAVREVPEVPGLRRVAGWEHSLLAALETLAVLRESFERDAPDRFIERLRTRTLIEAIEAARPLGRYRLANLERFLRRLCDDLCAEPGDPQAVLRSLRRRIREAEEEEEARPRDRSEETVQVRTIHQAKGLDFAHLYLVQTAKQPARGDADDVLWGRAGGLCEYSLLGASTLGSVELRERNEAIATCEGVRTLYVALTRARGRLAVVGDWPDSGAHQREVRSHAAVIAGREGATPELADLARELAATRRSSRVIGGVQWRFPSLEREDRKVRSRALATSLASLARVARDATALAAQQRAARAEMMRAFRGTPSLDPLLPGQRLSPGLPGDARVAAAVGSAVHRNLEDFDPDVDPERERERERAVLPALLRESVEPDALDTALERGGTLLERFQRGRLFGRLRSLGCDVARELPLIAPPLPDPDAPVGYLSGVIDLLYRDPETGEWVVADFKTDVAESDAELARLAEDYAPQGRAYVRAVQSGLELGEPPRFELWFLNSGKVVPVSI